MRKNKTVPFSVAWVDLKIVILSEVGQTEKDKCPLISLLSDGILKSGFTSEGVYKTKIESRM